MDSLNLRDIWLLDKKSRNLVEWSTFRLWLVMACNYQNRCDKSMAQRFWTAIVRAMGQQKRSKAHNFKFHWLVLKQICPIFSFLKSPHKKHVFRTFWGLSGRGRGGFYKKLCTCVLLQKMPCITKIIQKLGHHTSNLCFVGERNSEHGFFEPMWNLTIGQKEPESSRMEYV